MKINFKNFKLLLLILSVIGISFYIYKAYIYEPKPIFPLTENSPWPLLYDAKLWGDFVPDQDVVASVNQTLFPPLKQDIVYSYHLNKMGFRGNDQVVTGNQKKILILGDGYAFGVGLSGNDDLASQLAARLKNDYLPSSFVVFNGGNPGYSIADVLDYIKEKGRLIKSELVIITVSYDDLWELSRPVIYRQVYKHKLKSKLYNVYYNIKWDLIFSLHKCKRNYLKKHNISEDEALERLTPEYIKLACSVRDQIAQWKGVTLFILNNNIESEYLKKEMDRNGLNYIFIGHVKDMQKYFLSDGHWSIAMTSFIAVEIKKWVDKHLILNKN